MLNDATMRATPTTYIQAKRPGMYNGTSPIMELPREKCSAPKTANGSAKHKLVRATIRSRPRARAISFFAANRPITSTARPAADIQKAAPGKSKNTPRIGGCMDLLNQDYVVLRLIQPIDN